MTSLRMARTSPSRRPPLAPPRTREAVHCPPPGGSRPRLPADLAPAPILSLSSRKSGVTSLGPPCRCFHARLSHPWPAGRKSGGRGLGDRRLGSRVWAPRVPGYTPSPHSLLRPACFFDASWGKALTGHLATPSPPRVDTAARRAARKGGVLEQAPRTTDEESARQPAAPPAPSRKWPVGLRMLAPPPARARHVGRAAPGSPPGNAGGGRGFRPARGVAGHVRTEAPAAQWAHVVPASACSLGMMTARARHRRSPEHGADEPVGFTR